MKLEIPRGATLLDVGQRGGYLFLWFQVDDKAHTEERVFQVYGLGWDIQDPEKLSFVGSVVDLNGVVWFVYEELS
jgi:hypothetical protein